jgi:hypothetical protein
MWSCRNFLCSEWGCAYSLSGAFYSLCMYVFSLIFYLHAQELEDVISHTKECCSMNEVRDVDYIVGRWSPECADSALATNGGQTFDFVICADVLYHCEDFSILVSFINQCSTKSPCNLIISFEQRRRDLTPFFEELLQTTRFRTVRRRRYIVKDDQKKETTFFVCHLSSIVEL